jgi:glucose-1-phosphate cytidylyltransferase
MKVVLFCGGMGMRLKEYSDTIPKPLVEVGSRPILWHLMKYYAHFGHKDFILCLGHGATAIKNFFLKYDECVFNDFVYSGGGRSIDLLRRDIADWRITFVDTGLQSSIGERLRRVQEHVAGDDMFLANYADGLSDLDLAAYVASFKKRGKIASFITVPAPHTFHIVQADAEHYATKFTLVTESPVRINAGFFVLRPQIFEFMQPNEELVLEPFNRLIEIRELIAVPHDGFWRNMDTFKDKIELDNLVARGQVPWQMWRSAEP